MAISGFIRSALQGISDLWYSQPVRVDGNSMAPTLMGRQVTVVLPPREINRGDVVILVRPSPPWDKVIKRVVGMPDESIKVYEGRLYVDDMLAHPGFIPAGPEGKIDGSWWNGPDEYFVLGDNSVQSTDSRAFGPVRGERIIGRVWLRIWPPAAWGRVN